jgi:spore coat protein U domain-containing protein, fimbrial subunit CupE1/2/3/6
MPSVTTDRRRPGGLARLSAILLPGLFLAGNALAEADCSVAVSGLAFGTYDQLTTSADDSTGTVTVTCTSIGKGGGVTRVNYSVAFSTGASGSYMQRFMTSGTPRLDYNLYVDAARSTIWGNGNGGTQLITGSLTVGPGVGNGTRTETHTVYGRIPAQQDAAVGSYTDAIVLTLTF